MKLTNGEIYINNAFRLIYRIEHEDEDDFNWVYITALRYTNRKGKLNRSLRWMKRWIIDDRPFPQFNSKVWRLLWEN